MQIKTAERGGKSPHRMKGEKKMKMVFKFKVTFDFEEIQERYVCADTHEEAEKKLLNHIEQLKKEGCAEMHILCDPTVEIGYVID